MAHVFVDNSNVFHGAQRAAAQYEPSAPWPAVRVHYRTLFSLIEDGHTPRSRVLAGSVPPGNDDLWKHARTAGYDTNLLKKIEKDDGKVGEQGVDELLHLKIANVLLDHEPPQSLILVTGDAKVSDYGTSFLAQAERALRRGWDVHVWSWKKQLSPKFSKLTRPGKPVTIHYFDQKYFDLVYLERGSFTVAGKVVVSSGRVNGVRVSPANTVLQRPGLTPRR